MSNKKNKKFRLLILSKYDSEAALARKLNWAKQKLNKMTNGIKLPNVQEVNELSKALDVTTDTIIQIFLKV